MSGVGITFDETHSFRDWGLRLKKIVIGIPKAKTEYVSVPRHERGPRPLRSPERRCKI